MTNFLRDTLMQQDNPMTRPREEVAELLQEDIPGMEISHQDEPGFEVVTKVRVIAYLIDLLYDVTQVKI